MSLPGEFDPGGEVSNAREAEPNGLHAGLTVAFTRIADRDGQDCSHPRSPKTRPGIRIRHLLALGTPKRAAIWTGMSSKSYWHLSRSWARKPG